MPRFTLKSTAWSSTNRKNLKIKKSTELTALQDNSILSKKAKMKNKFSQLDTFPFSLALLFKRLFLRPPVVSLMYFNPLTQQKVAWESHSRSAFCALSKGMSHDLRSECCSCYSLYDVRDVRFWFECRFNVKQHEFYRQICSAEAAPFMFAAVTHTFDCFGFCRQCTLKCFFSCTFRFLFFVKTVGRTKIWGSGMDKKSLLNRHLQVQFK